ncbi:hypothetical protein VAEKB19_2570003 [Vibrio aestuarianus]|nr:hypothetical protein VAEKB19_2570003 [Vibrio aestuarianus]
MPIANAKYFDVMGKHPSAIYIILCQININLTRFILLVGQPSYGCPLLH